MELKTVYFENPGEENTEEVLRIVKQQAEALGIKTILVASTRGETAVKAVEALKEFRVICVSHSAGFKEPDIQEFTKENRKIVESKGVPIVTAAHVFAGLSRAMKFQYNTYGLNEIMADMLRIFGQGMKVACEITLMAADSGLVRTDEEVISIGGKSRGADTAIVLKPVNTDRIFDLRVKQILCKPLL